jgi:hypothetical protein
MTDIPEPEYIEELSSEQREKLLNFIDQAGHIFGGTDFGRYDRAEDCGIMALALRTALILGFEGESLEHLFRREFGIADITEGVLETWLAVITMIDIEKRIRCAAGGRN